jgi:parallel beta-helix repeat protein
MKRKCLTVGIILLFVTTGIIPAIAQDTEKPLPTSRGNWLYVGGSGPGNYSKIQDAIDNASDSDTVFVFDGTYFENIVIDKAIKLLGDNKNNTIIDGSSSNESIIIIKANDISIRGFTIRNSSPFHRGIFFQSHYKGVSIIDNIIKNTRGAIVLQSSQNINISRNVLIDNYNNPDIDLKNSSDNMIYRNIVIHTSEEHPDSISLIDNSNYNKIYGNSIRNCEYGIYSSGGSYNELSSNTISDNNLGVFLVWYGDHNNINNNTISNNINGIRTETTSNSSNNTIYHNNFLNNTIHAYVSNDCIDKWDNGYPFCGNYWDSYTGDDAFWGQNQEINGSDGVGDTPYNISGGDNKDRYPLMEPYGMTRLSFYFRGGLFKCSGILKNIGNTTAFNVQWNIGIDGGIILIGRDSSGIISKPLLAGEEIKVSTNLILGFGSIILTIAVWADNAPFVNKSTPGKVLLFFVII